jgi:hypothetical protein
MRKNFLTISLLIFIFNLFKINCENTDIICGNYTCVYGNGLCIKNGTESICICSEFYDSYPINQTLKCNYKRKKQYVAFLLETLVTYGAGHFYTGNYQLAVPKLFFWVISYCLFIFLRVVTKSNEESNTTALIISLLACLFLTGMLGWQLTDVIIYGMNLYMDGNGIGLLPWGRSENK